MYICTTLTLYIDNSNCLVWYDFISMLLYHIFENCMLKIKIYLKCKHNKTSISNIWQVQYDKLFKKCKRAKVLHNELKRGKHSNVKCVARLPQRLKWTFFEIFSSLQDPFGNTPLETILGFEAKWTFFSRFSSLWNA